MYFFVTFFFLFLLAKSFGAFKLVAVLEVFEMLEVSEGIGNI